MKKRREERILFTGKIAGLIFDHFGDFEGFILDTEDGERRLFSREKEIEELAERAWRERLRITVCVEHHSSHRRSASSFANHQHRSGIDLLLRRILPCRAIDSQSQVKTEKQCWI